MPFNQLDNFSLDSLQPGLTYHLKTIEFLNTDSYLACAQPLTVPNSNQYSFRFLDNYNDPNIVLMDQLSQANTNVVQKIPLKLD